MAEGSTQAATRQEKSLKSIRISNVLHIKASPKAGKAEASSDPVPTSPLVRPSVLAQDGRQQGAPALAPSACSMAHPSGVTRRNSAWYQPGHLPARQACSLKKGCQTQIAVESIWILLYSPLLVAVDATSAGTGWAVPLDIRMDTVYEGEDTSADSSVSVSSDCEKAAKQEDFRDGLCALPLPVSPASAKHACLPSTEESLDVLQSVSPSDEM